MHDAHLADLLIHRPVGVAAPLIALVQELEEGRLSFAQFQPQLDAVSSKAARVLRQLSEHHPEACADILTLFQMGLDEIRAYPEEADPACLRLGRLLLEKAEQEVLRLQQRGPDQGRERTTNLWGYLADHADRSFSDDWPEVLAWADWALQAHMKGTLSDFQRALAALRQDPDHPDEARQKMVLSLHRLKDFLGLST